MRPRQNHRVCILFSLLVMLVSGCSSILPGPRTTPSLPPSSTPAASDTPAPPTAPATSTPLPSPTSTATPLPSSTPTALVLAEQGTPLPSAGLPPISYDNAALVSGLARFKVNSVTDLDWAPDGETLAVAGYNGISIYDRLSRSQISTLETYPGVISVDFNPRGSLLAVGHRFGSEQDGFAGSVNIWRVSSWQPLGPILGGNQAVSQVAFSPTGNSLASAFISTVYDDNRVVFWDTLGWEISRTLQTGTVQNIAFSPDGLLMAVSPDRYAVEIYRLLDGILLQKLHTSFTGAVNALAFSPDGAKLATGHYDGEVRLWNPQTGELQQVLATGGVVESLAFNRDGTILASGEGISSNQIELWDVEIAQRLRTLDGHEHPVVSLEFSPDGSLLASGSYEGSVWLWGIRP
jgi:WD40 repeat protein